MMTEPGIDYFTLLELDPLATWDEEKFKKALSTRQKQWTRESMGIDTDAQIARKNLESIDEIRRIMSDQRLRTLHKQSINSHQSMDAGERKQQRLIEFEQILIQKEKKGYLEEKEYQELVNRFQDLSENWIISQLNVDVRSSKKEKEPEKSAEHLEPAVLHDITAKLVIIQVKNLYSLIGQSPDVPSDLLVRSAESLYTELAHRQPKTTEGDIRQFLAGHARNIFSSPHLRQEYDQALAQAPQQAHPPVASPEPLSSQKISQEIPISPVPPAPLAPQMLPERKEIEQLKLLNLGKALRLSWLWPGNCYEVLVAYSEREWPRPAQGVGTALKVTRAYYEESGGHFDLQVPANQHYYIIVSPVKYQNGKANIGNGARTEGDLRPQATISYEIRNPRLGYRDRTLHLFIQPPALIPTLLLLSKRNGLPLHNADGELLYKIAGPLEINQRETIIKLPERNFSPNTLAKLFLEDKDLIPFVPILTPNEKKLRLSQ